MELRDGGDLSDHFRDDMMYHESLHDSGIGHPEPDDVCVNMGSTAFLKPEQIRVHTCADRG